MEIIIKEVEKKVRDYLTKQFLFSFDDSSVNSQTDLFKEGIIDSFGFVELVSFLEKEFEIKFSDDELLSNSLNSLVNITCIVEKKITNVT